MNLKPYRLLLKLHIPVVVTRFAPTLDALIFEAAKQRYPEKSDGEIIEIMKSFLKFSEEFGVFHTSSMMFGVDSANGLVAKSYNRTDYMHEGKLSSSMYALAPRQKKYSNINFNGGATKKRMTQRPAYSAPFVVFDFFGDKNSIENYLKNSHLGIGYDALNVTNGEFDTQNVEFVDLKTDISLIENEKAKRTLPASCGAKGQLMDSPLLPPYYSDRKVQVVAPQRIQITNIELI